MATTTELITVEVAYALPERQWLVTIELERGASADDAVQAATSLEEFPELTGNHADLGIWGQRVEQTHVLRDGDRVQILRPLRMDPRTARRQLAAQGLVMGHPSRKISSD